MADESTCVAVLRTFPCEPKDYNTARCRIAPRVMRAIGANIGSVISVNLSSFNVLCTAWPRDDGIEDAVQFDAFITQGIKSEEGRPIEKNLRHVKLRVPDDFRVLRTVEAEEVVLSIHVSSDSDEQELYQGPSVPKQLQEDRNERYMRAVLRNHTITLDCCIRPRKSRNESNGLLAEIEKIVVESTKPFSCECAVYGPETQPIPGEQQTAAFVRVTDKTKILVRSVKRYSDDTIPSYFSLAGVETAAKTLKELIEYPFLYPESFSYLGLECPKGVLLQGEPGVGKTLLVKTVTSECRAQLVTLNGTDVFGPHPGESEQNLRRAFEKARSASRIGPCVLFIDEVDALCPKRGTSTGGQEENRLVAQLLTLMDGLESRGRLVVIGATNRPNAIDPALRRPGRFDKEIVIGVPNITERLAILEAHTTTVPLSNDVSLAHLAEITLGYVGADLASLCREATFLALKRNALQMKTEKETSEEQGANKDRTVRMSDFELAMCHIVPSTYRGLDGIVDVQSVKWEDIGGLGEVKLALQQAIEWPLKYPEAFARLGLVRPRGVLLYGPPGCCKTTLVRAAASSCHVTFLSLSCAQLFSPYVGDAERRIRELFLKARSTAPSILFLDELDVIAAKRSDSSCSGVEARLLATLLNEMDGIGVSANIYEVKSESMKEGAECTQSTGGTRDEVLGVSQSEQGRESTQARDDPSSQHASRSVRNLTTKDVLVVAATNRPGAIDEAFVRPGRIDRVIYVPPPDLEARLEILKVQGRRCPFADDVDLRSLADKTELFSGADLENLCREAALYSLEDQGMSASTIEKKHVASALAALRPSLTQSIVDKYKHQ